MEADGKVDFKALIRNIKSCELCPRMLGRSRVFGHENGKPEVKVLFIAEAPGRLGADRTCIPLHGDQTGRNFEFLINSIELSRSDIFITNAVLCNPQDELGRNSTPTTSEIINCSGHLSETIKVISPEVIVTLGKVALDSLRLIEEHDFSLSKNAGKVEYWRQYVLIPMYHPGARARVHRPVEQQLADFAVLKAKLQELDTAQIQPPNDSCCSNWGNPLATD